jgi:hypothetical protein
MFKTLVFTISVLLGQAGMDIFLVNADRLEETVASDDGRKDLKKLGKAYAKAQKEYQFLRHNQAESFVDAMQKRDAQSSELRSLLNQFKNEQTTYLSVLLDLRNQIQAVPDSGEWNDYLHGYYKKAIFLKQTEIFSALKETDKIKSLENTLNRVFAGSKYEEQARSSVEKYLQTLTEITENEADRRISSGSILRRQNASRMELQKVLEDQFLFEKALGDAFIQLRADILKITEPADWNAIALKLSKLVYE